MCKQLIEDFFNNCAKIGHELIRITGHNRARQRDCYAVILEDLATFQENVHVLSRGSYSTLVTPFTYSFYLSRTSNSAYQFIWEVGISRVQKFSPPLVSELGNGPSWPIPTTGQAKCATGQRVFQDGPKFYTFFNYTNL